jgi:hypothetical protein
MFFADVFFCICFSFDLKASAHFKKVGIKAKRVWKKMKDTYTLNRGFLRLLNLNFFKNLRRVFTAFSKI